MSCLIVILYKAEKKYGKKSLLQRKRDNLMENMSGQSEYTGSTKKIPQE